MSHKPLLTFVGILFLAAHLHGQEQPIPYSHKTHLALGLECRSCHKNSNPGSFMGFPATEFCMNCHQAIKTESPHVQKLAAAAKAGESIQWERIYEIKKYVYFSHRVHLKAGATCETCHGPVRERDVMEEEVKHNMKSCMACHEANKAPNECGTCHEENF